MAAWTEAEYRSWDIAGGGEFGALFTGAEGTIESGCVVIPLAIVWVVLF
jgi:hypothetical protein